MGQRSVRFPDELEAAVLRMASEHERSFSWLVVKALEAFVPAAYLSGARALEKAPGAEDRVPERAVPAPSRAPGMGKGYVPPRPKS